MPQTSVPQYSRKKLSFMVNDWLNSINYPLFANRYLDIDMLLDFLKKKAGVSYIEKSLGGVGQYKVLGLMQPKENTIYIDTILNERMTMKRFTQAHEIAHWYLHRNCDLADYTLEDTPDRLNQKRTLSSTYDWVEWQANTFAAFLLIPEKRFFLEFDKSCHLLGLKKQIKDLQPFEFIKIQAMLAHTFYVSKTVIGIYIQGLKKAF